MSQSPAKPLIAGMPLRLIAATLLIDLTWFENGRRGQRHGVMGLFGSR